MFLPQLTSWDCYSKWDQQCLYTAVLSFLSSQNQLPMRMLEKHTWSLYSAGIRIASRSSRHSRHMHYVWLRRLMQHLKCSQKFYQQESLFLIDCSRTPLRRIAQIGVTITLLLKMNFQILTFVWQIHPHDTHYQLDLKYLQVLRAAVRIVPVLAYNVMIRVLNK